ncbi:MAG: hypothetical protein ACFFAU_20870 [Candidatus Hodarchaeota archaeon]
MANRCLGFGDPDRAGQPNWGGFQYVTLRDLATTKAESVLDPRFRQEHLDLMTEFDKWWADPALDFEAVQSQLSEMPDAEVRRVYKDLASARWAATATRDGHSRRKLLPLVLNDGTTLDALFGRLVGPQLEEFSAADLVEAIGLCVDYFLDERRWDLATSPNPVGAVVGGSGSVNIGGEHYYGVAVGPGAGAHVGGDAQAGGDLIGRDQVGGDKITVGNVSTLVINTGSTSPPETPLIEEAIRLGVAAPPTAILEVPFDLAVAVRQPDAPPLAVDELTQVKSEEGSVFRHEEDEVVLYRIAVTAAGCEVEPTHYVLKLRPRANSRRAGDLSSDSHSDGKI